MITLLFAASLGVVLVWATGEHEQVRVLEDDGQSKDLRISELPRGLVVACRRVHLPSCRSRPLSLWRFYGRELDLLLRGV